MYYYVGKVSNRFELFGEIFAERLVSKKIWVMSNRVSNILRNAYLSKKVYREKRLKNTKNGFTTVFLVKTYSIFAKHSFDDLYQLRK